MITTSEIFLLMIGYCNLVRLITLNSWVFYCSQDNIIFITLFHQHSNSKLLQIETWLKTIENYSISGALRFFNQAVFDLKKLQQTPKSVLPLRNNFCMT